MVKLWSLQNTVSKKNVLLQQSCGTNAPTAKSVITNNFYLADKKKVKCNLALKHKTGNISLEKNPRNKNKIDFC